MSSGSAIVNDVSRDEPSAFDGLTPEQKQRLTVVLDAYLTSLENNAPRQIESLVAEHPDLAEPLEFYVRSLVELHDAAAGFQAPRPAHEQSDDLEHDDARRLGDFELVGEIGRGGMGVVYEARQVSLNRRVALKVLPFAAVLDSRQIARFKNEAMAAAQLHHPNIAPVFAVGSERGVYYYAMQLIDGQPLDRAIAELRQRRSSQRLAQRSAERVESEPRDRIGLDSPEPQKSPEPDEAANATLADKWTSRQAYFRTAARLGIQAALALQAAHEEGVVHRDIKPSNLMLDGDGKLWVTDFGLARFQANGTITRTGDVVGTMRYMSPEQATGDGALVDARSDVYSLGVTLYELLTLQPAFRAEDGAALMREIDLHQPVRPRKLQPHLPADLETVVLKAMAHARDDRYRTARELADDLQRVLDGRPTQARPPSLADQWAGWARRHRRVVLALAAMGLLAVVGLSVGAAFVGREKANTQRNYERAERNRRDAQDVLDRFGTRLAERLADVPGAEQVRQELLRETLRYYHKFANQAADDPALRADLATTYGKIGSLQAEIGNWEQAESAQRQAVSLFQRLADASHDLGHRRQAAVCQSNLALAVARSGQPAEALSLYNDAIERQSRLLSEAADQLECQSELALSLNNLGLLHGEVGETDEAAAAFRRAIQLQEFVQAQRPNSVESLRTLAASYNNLGGLFVDADAPQAADWYRRALECQTRAALIEPTDLRLQSDVALSLNNLAGAQSRQDDLQAAAKSYGRAIEIQQQLVEEAPSRTAYRHDLSVSHNNLGLVRNRQRRLDEAADSFQAALQILQSLVEDDPHNIDARSSIGGIHNNLGMMLESDGELRAAAEQFALAVHHQTAAFDRAGSVVRLRQFLETHHANLARVLAELASRNQVANDAGASVARDSHDSFVANLMAKYPEVRRSIRTGDSK